ncbi:MAG: hypothetical protein HKM03_10110 [Steroidobacteraceae bacterium]|nr:hypothetical protein [Steroidobacteraceae bacterium]
MRALEIGHDTNHRTWRFWLPRLLISSVVIASYGMQCAPSNRLPFHAACDRGVCMLAPIPADAAAAPVHAGDHLRFAEQHFATRAALIEENVPRRLTFPLSVHRGTAEVRIAFHAVRADTHGRAAGLTVAAFILLFGLLMLWRGETAATAGLCLFALSIVVGGGVKTIPLAPPWNLVASGLWSLLGGPTAFLGLYVTAAALARPRGRIRRRRGALVAYIGVLILMYLSELRPAWAMLAGQQASGWLTAGAIPIALGAIALVVPLITLIQGYRHGDAESRLRIRWFIASVVLLLPLVATNMLVGSTDAEHDLLRWSQVLLNVAIFTMLSYAALSQRLVAVRFVANRALVFGLLTALLIGTLSLLESLIERSVISKNAGMALDLAVPLLLGISIQRIHRWGEDSVERLIFRREYRDRNAILAFLRDAGFVAHPTTLFERTTEVFASHAGGRSAALYLIANSGYERVAASETARGAPARLPVDDAAMVRLRATLAPLDLSTVSSAQGASGLALPLVIRGRLEGVLVCGAKPEGRYARAEVEFLDKAATGIAACIVALRAELHGRFVTRVAEGALPTDQVVQEARRLVAT